MAPRLSSGQAPSTSARGGSAYGGGSGQAPSTGSGQALEELIAVARGDAPGDLLLANGRIVNVFTSEVEEGDVVVCGGRIAGVGRGYRAREVVNLKGAYLLPGFINGHTHIESSLLSIGQYARAVVARGTTAVVTDLHELANVAGLWALRRFMRDAARLPLDVYLMVPSCVPATALETAGASLEPKDIARALRWPNTLGLGELMNFPGVLAGDPHCLGKVAAAKGRLIDGHAPGLMGQGLNAYLAAGPRSDHESTHLEEGRDKLRRGMHLMIREGTSEKNLEELLPLVTDDTYPRCLLVVDDRSCRDLLHDGDIDAIVRKAIRLGLNPVRAIQLTTINPATYFGLRDRGAIAPGYAANLVVADDLSDLHARQVYYGGRLVASDGRAIFSAAPLVSRRLTRTFHIKAFGEEAFALSTTDRSARGGVRMADKADRLPVIEIVPGQIITRKVVEEVKVEDGRVVADTQRDILKLAVVERHQGTGNIGLGLVTGFGLRRGALASSFAHDSHNVVVVGTNDR
ncbi:MAG: adenine deaminase C-terminal domain-containing protein, partial [Chloroflexota bacterium]|nr:adenine deaminase C-terminal domain-containing protein [Chloroflexota bacterium]